jgi:hypothetical protein
MDKFAWVFAVLHILESAISYWLKRHTLVQFTLVVLIGKMEDSNKEVRKSRARSAGETVEESKSPMEDDFNSLADQSTVTVQ